MKTLTLAALVLVLAFPAIAQQVDIRATPPGPERPPEWVTPGPYYDITEPRENDWYPEGVRVPYDPAFIAPLSEEYETPTERGRYGVAGWTSQNLPVGAPGTMYREQAGWLSFGFAFTWGGPPRRPAPRPAPAARPAPAPSR
jgi:hypothetical protein